MHKITSLELLRTPILLFSATKQLMRMWRPQMLKDLSQSEKVAKCNFKSKAQATWKIILSNEMKCFCNAEDRFSWVWAFLPEKVILELNAQNHFFRASKNTNSVFSANKQINENVRPQMLKSFFLSQKKLLNAILRAKLNTWKMILSNEINSFLQCRRQIFMSLSFFAEKGILELKCTKILLRASKNTNSLCFSATKQLWECEATDAQKTLLSHEKSC